MNDEQRHDMDSYRVSIDGRALELAVLDCTVCLGGEFAGNVDLRISCSDAEAEELARRLAVRVPGVASENEVIGAGPEDRGFGFTFGSEALADLGEPPDCVTLLFDGKVLGELACRVSGSVSADTQLFTDPLEILRGAAPPIDGFHTGRRRGPALSAAGIAFAAGSAALAATSLQAHGSVMTPALAAAGITGVMALMALVLMRVPSTQIRVDPMRGTVSVLRVRCLFFVTRILDEAQYRPQDFSHLRIIERVRPTGEDGYSSVWFVLLEGPIRWAGNDRDVHLRGDSIQLDEFSSQLAARRFAARIAASFGLRVLDTSESSP